MRYCTMHYFNTCIWSMVVLIIIGGSVLHAEELDPTDILFPYEWVGDIDQIDFAEPSGIVYHSQRKTLFVVGDRGDVCEMKKDGILIQQKHIRDADFEGITFDPSSNLLYIAIEGEEKIAEINPDNLEVTREFTIERTFQGNAVLKTGGEGIEALTFVPDSNHPEGGTFFVANQSFDHGNHEDISAIFEVAVPLKTSTVSDATVKITRFFSLGVIDLSGLHYDEIANCLYVISDATNTLFEVTLDGSILKSYAFPGDNQEGVTVDDEGHIYIAQDTGGIIKLKWIK